jgi:hypothetical protein
VVRPYCAWDIGKLESSFDTWAKNLPCDVDQSPDLDGQVDLLLYFSGRFESFPWAKTTAETIINSFYLGHFEWSCCFRDIFLDTANLTHAEDKYDPSVQNRDLGWVNGPNRQFEAITHLVQSPHFRKDENASVGYGSFFLIEPDTTPWHHGWLMNLVDEIKANAPFAMLGSKYHGYKWHDFEEGLPLPYSTISTETQCTILLIPC